jgi:Fe-S-cluster containining protein
MAKEIEMDLPCVECGMLDLTCCKNPQIVWDMEEMDKLYSNYPEIFSKVSIFKGEIPGTVYLIKVKTEDIDDTNSVNIDYCSMYDEDNRRCSVYDCRPNVCKTYGDPKYASCPYENYKEEGELTDLLVHNKDLAENLHKIAPTNPGVYIQDFVLPWIERFEESKKESHEYYDWWEKLPEPNFIRT